MSELPPIRSAMTEAELLIRAACAEPQPAARSQALMQAYRLARNDVQLGLVMGLIARVAMQPVVERNLEESPVR